MPSSGASRAMEASVALEAQPRVLDGHIEVFADVVVVDDFPDLHADLVGGHRRLGAPCHSRGDPCEARFGGGQEFVTRPCTVRGQGRVVTHHEPFAGIGVAGDLGEVRRIEERGLERAVLGQRANGRKAQRGNPAHSGMPAQGVDLRVCQHAPVADQHHALQPKPHA